VSTRAKRAPGTTLQPVVGDDKDLGQVLEFMRTLWALDHAMQATSKRMASELGVTGPQRLVIRIVGRKPGISAGDLAEVLHVHPSTLTGVLHRLQHRGFLVRKADPDDRRRALLTLTDKGRTLDTNRSGTTEAAVRRILAKLSGPDVEVTRKVLANLTTELSDGVIALE
jgi:DNA-binding MarR family transcriptional regulator